MKGLNQFIVDIRNTQTLDEERKRINLEINNIQTKFSSTSLNSYQKKKYICKLIYIYLLGYDKLNQFGIEQSLLLIDVPYYTEKQLGYLALSILFTNHGNNQQYIEFLAECSIQRLINDLRCNNDDINNLAILFIGTNFNVNFTIDDDYPQAMKWLELVDMVYSTTVSPMTSFKVRKKSLVALRCLLGIYPGILVNNNNWIPRLLSLMDDNNDLSIILNSIPLVEFIVRINPKFIPSLIPSIANNLYNFVISNNCPDHFYYYDTPAPWLIVKLYQLLETCFMIDPDLVIDNRNLNNLRLIISRSIQNASKSIHGLPNRNSQSSILFQAVSLAIFLHASSDAIRGAIEALINFLASPETNTRYLSLDALIKLMARSDDKKYIITEKLTIISHLLTDKDISIKRKALDLLYIICNDDNYQIIINRLIDYFPMCEHSLKSELSIKVAILTEKFAKDSTWYVNIMIKLISLPNNTPNNSDYLDNEIWERIIQIVINNPDLQYKTCKLILVKLSNSNNITSSIISENLIKIAGFIIGEFGTLVEQDFSPSLQFQILYDCYLKVGLSSRVILLSSFCKFLLHYPNEQFVPEIIDLFEIECNSIDLEIQTRSFEYLKLFTTNPDSLKQVIKPLPPFEAKHNPLLSNIGGIERLIGNNRSSSFVNPKHINSRVNSSNPNLESSDENPFQEKIILSPNWYDGYHRMLHYDAGIFFENQLVKITYRIIRVDNFKFRYRFVVINNSFKTTNANLTSFKILNLTSLTASVNPNYLIDIVNLPQQVVGDKTNMEFEVKIRNVVENNELPVLSMSFNCGGSFNQLNLKLPINMLKTLTCTEISMEEFKSRWLQINQLLPNNEGEHMVRCVTSHKYNAANIIRVLQRLNLHVVQCLDNEGENMLVLAAGILHTQSSNYGLLLTIKSVDNVGKHFEIVVKCTGGGVAEVVATTIGEIFEKVN